MPQYNEILNTTELMTGKDGKLFVTVGGQTYFLAEINQYSVTMDVATTDYQPVGSIIIYGVDTGVTFNLTYTEAVVRDDVTLEPMLEAIHNGYLPIYDFQGVATRRDGAEERLTFNNAVPNGTVGLQSLTPGEIITREQSYRLNAVPKLIQSLASNYLRAV